MSLLAAHAYGALLVFARVLPLSVLSLVWKRGLASVGLALSLALALSVGLGAQVSLETASPAWLLSRAVRELLLGGAFALAVSIPFWALQMGVRGAEWAALRAQRGLWADLYVYCAVLLSLQLGVDRALLSGFVAGLEEVPLAASAAVDSVAFFSHVLTGVSDAFLLSLSIALPLFASIALTDLTFAAIQRALGFSGQPVSAGAVRALLVMLVLTLLLAATSGRAVVLLRDSVEQGRQWVRDVAG